MSNGKRRDETGVKEPTDRELLKEICHQMVAANTNIASMMNALRTLCTARGLKVEGDKCSVILERFSSAPPAVIEEKKDDG